MFYERMLKEKQRIEAEITAIEQQLKNFPPGNLFFVHDKNRCKWYQSNGRGQKYISKKNHPFAEQLAVKKYLSYLRNDLIHELKSLECYLTSHNTIAKAPQLLSQESEYKEFLASHFTPVSEILTEWQNASFEHNMQHPEQLTQPTISGKMVRSKSEALIDTILYKHKLPYRYECALPIGNKIFYPDFTIRHPFSNIYSLSKPKLFICFKSALRTRL